MIYRLLASLALAFAATAEVRLPFLLTDHMVVQRDRPVHIWGTAAPGEAVSVAFRGDTKNTAADRLGRWSVYLPPRDAGGPFEVTIRATNTVVLRDIYAGDVWIAAGQSNMEWPVRWSANPKTEIAAADFPKVRLVRTMHRVSDYPRDEFYGQAWQPCSPQTIEHFSAVAYHFARQIHEKTGVAIGIVQTAWGGTPIEAWTPLAAIALEPALMPIFGEWAGLTAQHETDLLEYPLRIRDWNKLPPASRPERPEMRRRPGGQWTPAGLFNAMVAPLTKIGIRGVIWYQGEANTDPERAPYYGKLLSTLIRGWRTEWNVGSFPFLIVQLANYKGSPDGMWPEVREGQRSALQLADTAMTVSIDLGNPDDIHPRNKRDVGHRLSLAARALAYGEKIECSGPLFRRAAAEGSAMRVWFDHASGLTAKSGALAGFEIAGADERWFPARARIDGDTVVATASGVEAPVAVRYAWKDNPLANLYNGAGLPASPFRSDSPRNIIR